MIKKLLIGLLTFGLATSLAQAGIINLVQNGEFEVTPNNPRTWTPFDDVAHWNTGEEKLEIWAESFQWDGDKGSDGLATGQHAEITWNHDKNSIWTSFFIPENFLVGSTAVFSFDYRNRRSAGIESQVVLNYQQASSTELLSYAGSSSEQWSGASFSIEGLSAGDNVALLFQSQGGRSSGAHIDQVEFNVAVPIPNTVALLGFGLAGLGFTRRKQAEKKALVPHF